MFRRRHWFQGRPLRGTVDICWLRPDAAEMDDADWEADYARSIAVFLNGDTIAERRPARRAGERQAFLLLFNAHSYAVRFVLPGAEHAHGWHAVVDTAAPPGRSGTGAGGWPPVLPCGAAVEVAGRSIMVLPAADDPASEASPARTL